MKSWVWAGTGFAILIGALLPLQALINARLGTSTNGPLYAAFVSFLVGTLVLAGMLMVTRTPLLPSQPLSSFPGWIWLGGLIGALFVFAMALLVPRLGAASMICLVVFGQVAASLLLDHHGVLGPSKPADLTRIFGALLVFAGAMLVMRPWQQA